MKYQQTIGDVFWKSFTNFLPTLLHLSLNKKNQSFPIPAIFYTSIIHIRNCQQYTLFAHFLSFPPPPRCWFSPLAVSYMPLIRLALLSRHLRKKRSWVMVCLGECSDHFLLFQQPITYRLLRNQPQLVVASCTRQQGGERVKESVSCVFLSTIYSLNSSLPQCQSNLRLLNTRTVPRNAWLFWCPPPTVRVRVRHVCTTCTYVVCLAPAHTHTSRLHLACALLFVFSPVWIALAWLTIVVEFARALFKTEAGQLPRSHTARSHLLLNPVSNARPHAVWAIHRFWSLLREYVGLVIYTPSHTHTHTHTHIRTHKQREKEVFI